MTTGPSGFGSMSDTPTELPGPAPVDGPLGEAIKKRRNRAGAPPSPAGMPRSKDRLPGEEPPTVAGTLPDEPPNERRPAAPPVAGRALGVHDEDDTDLDRVVVTLHHHDGHTTTVTLETPYEAKHAISYDESYGVRLYLDVATQGSVSRTQEWKIS